MQVIICKDANNPHFSVCEKLSVIISSYTCHTAFNLQLK